MTTNNKEPNAFIHPNFSSTSDIDSSQSDDQGYEDSQKSNRNGRIFSYPDIETAKVDEDATKNTITTDTVLSNSNDDDEKDKDGGINDESQPEAHGNKIKIRRNFMVHMERKYESRVFIYIFYILITSGFRGWFMRYRVGCGLVLPVG